MLWYSLDNGHTVVHMPRLLVDEFHAMVDILGDVTMAVEEVDGDPAHVTLVWNL